MHWRVFLLSLYICVYICIWECEWTIYSRCADGWRFDVVVVIAMCRWWSVDSNSRYWAEVEEDYGVFIYLI